MLNKTLFAVAMLGASSLARRNDENGNGQIDKVFAACHIDVDDPANYDEVINFFIGLADIEGKGAKLRGSAITELDSTMSPDNFCENWGVTINGNL